MRFRITEITEWEEDCSMEAGDSSHMSDGDIMRAKLAEYEEKIEGGKWPGLPFECDAKDEAEAIDTYNEINCGLDYYKALDAEIETLKGDPRLKIIITDINWDITNDDDPETGPEDEKGKPLTPEALGLPREVEVYGDAVGLGLDDDTDDYDEILGDYLSDKYGYLHNGFTYETVKA